jgi:trans-aconitate methyltransferase
VVRALSLTKPEIFAELEDPWGFTHSTYERERYTLTARVLGTLTRQRAPRSVVDVGACEGLMTEQLRALFPEAVVHAVESDPHFVARLRERLGGDGQVRIVEASALDVPLEADLVLLAEVLYYLPVEAGRELLGRLRASHLLTSYGGPFGEEVHAALRELGWRQVVGGSLPARIEPVDGVASPLLVRRAGTEVRLWSR